MCKHWLFASPNRIEQEEALFQSFPVRLVIKETKKRERKGIEGETSEKCLHLIQVSNCYFYCILSFLRVVNINERN
jgi:hypothetical protein